jgi:hypothetical protein
LRYIHVKADDNRPHLFGFQGNPSKAKQSAEKSYGKGRLFIPFHLTPNVPRVIDEIIFFHHPSETPFVKKNIEANKLFGWIDSEFDGDPGEIFILYHEPSNHVAQAPLLQQRRKKKPRGRWRRYRQQQEAA